LFRKQNEKISRQSAEHIFTETSQAPEVGFAPKKQKYTPLPPEPTLEKVNKCQKCGTQLRKGKKFCTNCGKPIADAESLSPSSTQTVCKRCGALLKPNTQFCTKCGKPQEE
jgi:ribosomal protein L37E